MGAPVGRGSRCAPHYHRRPRTCESRPSPMYRDGRSSSSSARPAPARAALAVVRAKSCGSSDGVEHLVIGLQTALFIHERQHRRHPRVDLPEVADQRRAEHDHALCSSLRAPQAGPKDRAIAVRRRTAARDAHIADLTADATAAWLAAPAVRPSTDACEAVLGTGRWCYEHRRHHDDSNESDSTKSHSVFPLVGWARLHDDSGSARSTCFEKAP